MLQHRERTRETVLEKKNTIILKENFISYNESQILTIFALLPVFGYDTKHFYFLSYIPDVFCQTGINSCLACCSGLFDIIFNQVLICFLNCAMEDNLGDFALWQEKKNSNSPVLEVLVRKLSKIKTCNTKDSDLNTF